jgi:putative transcriptional regulator
MRKSLTGQLLVATTTVTDPMYANSVCLVVHEDETRVIGVILNRPIEPNSEALRTILGETDLSIPRSPSNRFSAGEMPEGMTTHGSESASPHSCQGLSPPTRSLHFGGPLSGPIVALHQASCYADAETGDGIYVAAQKDHLLELIRSQNEPCRLIVGHLGWNAEELEAEIEGGIWHPVPASVNDVFSPAREMWPGIIRRATSTSLAKWIGLPDANAVGELN